MRTQVQNCSALHPVNSAFLVESFEDDDDDDDDDDDYIFWEPSVSIKGLDRLVVGD